MSNENKTDIRVVSMNAYVKPDIKETQSAEWVLNGKYNSFYQYIIDRFNGSATNAAVINSYIDLIYGKGLRNMNGNVTDFLKFRKMLSESELRKLVNDYELFGEAIVQVIKANGNGKLPTLYQMPKELTAPQKQNEDGEIEGYWFCKDWKKATDETTEFFPILSDKKETSCYPIRPYKSGKLYFSDPDYLAGLQYAELEEEISNYYLSHIINGLSFGYFVNIPNGNAYTPEEKQELENKIKRNLTGSQNAGRFVINFNGSDAKVEVTAIEINDAHKQWQYLTSEARQQLLTAHRVTSPMLFGIKDNTGLGNNANELDVAEAQLMKRVVAPKQKFITDALEQIARTYDLNLELRFAPLTDPTEIVEKVADVRFTEVGNTLTLSDELESYARPAPKGYSIESIEEVGDETELDDIEAKLNSIKLAEIESNATTKSTEDSPLYKVRYRYKKLKSPKGDSREFCTKMHQLAGNNKYFRKEDIGFMSAKGVNNSFGHKGQNYSIFLYKGGVNCHDVWERVIFKKDIQDNGKPMVGNPLQNVEQVDSAPGVKPLPTKVTTAPIDMPNQGRYPG